MAATVEELQVQRAQIVADMSKPEEAHFSDRGLRRRSIEEARKALAVIDSEIAIATATATGVRRGRITRITTSKGF